MEKITEHWIENPDTRAVCAALTTSGAQALFVGGCVRDALFQAPVSDIDIATDAIPNQVMDLARQAGLQAVPTGIEHGTVTVFNNDVPYQITTFRRDVATDGRRAVIAFSDRIEDDAARRDFTMNALYATPDGTILDPLGGLPDVHARRLRFVGDAKDRIREDYLRSLRYFRFHAWYGNRHDEFDLKSLSAISENLDGLKTLSRERVGSEILKLLSAPNPTDSVAAMRECGVLARILPGYDDSALKSLIRLEQNASARPDPIRRLAVLAPSSVAETLRLSKAQLKRLVLLRQQTIKPSEPGELSYRFGMNDGRDIMLLRNAVLERPWSRNIDSELEQGNAAYFPVKSTDLIAEFKGPALGARLAEMESRWIDSDFTLDRSALLADECSPEEYFPF